MVANEGHASTKFPQGFEDLFVLKERQIKLRNLDQTYTDTLGLLATYNKVALDKNNQASIKKVTEFLQNNAIDNAYQRAILNQLIQGVEDKDLCRGELSRCEVTPDEFEWVYNYNDNELYLFVNSKILSYQDHDEDKTFYDPRSADNALINSSDLYVSKYSDQEGILSLNDKAVLGLPYGYLKTDFNATTYNGSSQLYEVSYNLDVEGNTYNAGYFEYDPNVNSTDFLNNTAKMPQRSLTFSSSNKLLVGGKSNYQVISFYSPRSGSVELYRDGRLVYQNNIDAGQNTIRYSDLPQGRYEARLDILNSGDLVSSQTYQIYNSQQDSLEVGSVDYAISGGVFSDSYYDYDQDQAASIEDDAYGKALVSYRPFASLLLGVGALATKESSLINAGARFNWLDSDLNTEIVYSQFEQAEHFNANIGIPNLNVSYEFLNNEQGDPLASFMYGYADYSRFSVNLSQTFGGGKSFYAIYTLNENRSLSEYDADAIPRDRILSLGYATPFVLNSWLNLNFDYSAEEEDTSFSLLWTLPLSETIDVITGLDTTNSSLGQVSTSLRKNNLFDSDSVNSSLELSNTFSRLQSDMYQELTFNGSTRNQYVDTNLNAYSSTKGEMGISGKVSNTQVVTTNSVSFTDQAAPSYLLIDVESEQNIDNSLEKGTFTLKKERQDNSKLMVYEDSTLIPLQDYTNYQAYFDAESVDFYNSGDNRIQAFSYPGTLSRINPKINRVVSFISVFRDFNGTPINQLKCEGAGCLSVSEVVDDVYRVSVLEGVAFKLSSDQYQCLIPKELAATNKLNFGVNYCLPTTQSETDAFSDAQSKIKFLGVYQSSLQLKQEIARLSQAGFNVIEKPIGQASAIYLATSHMAKEFEASNGIVDAMRVMQLTDFNAQALTTLTSP